MGDRFNGTLLGVIEGCTNPESAELLDDGETIIFGNCRLDVGFDWFRQGEGLVYLEGEAFVSRGRVSARGEVTLEERTLIGGLTTTLGCDVMRTSATALPRGTVLMAVGGKPVTRDGSGPARAWPQVLAFDPASGEVAGRIPLGEGSPIARRFEALEMPNGLAIDAGGNLYVTDCPHTNPVPDPAAPPPSTPAVYRIPAAALGPLLRDEPGAADAVSRVVMPGYVNGATASPVDGTCFVVSCSPLDPVNGGVYQLAASAFASGAQPPPRQRGLGQLDGVGVTRRGTVLAGTPLENKIHAFTPDGEHGLVTGDGLPCRMPADFNVVYPRCLDGEPALLITDIMVGTGPGECTVSVLAIPGL
jgi:hypothetical protein